MPSTDVAFNEVAQMIAAARQRAVRAVNTELVELYWQVGAYISRKIEAAEWGDGVVRQLADYLARKQPGLRGFTRANLFRMRQFYEVYRDEKKVAPLVRQLSWSHNLVVLAQSKQPKEREFYLRMAVQEQWSRRELERQIKSALFERSLTRPAKVSTALRQMHPEALRVFKDAYVVEFLDLAQGHNCRTRSCCRPSCMSFMRLILRRFESRYRSPDYFSATPSQTARLARHVGVSLN